MANAVGIFRKSVENILQDWFHMMKVSVHWVPRLLSRWIWLFSFNVSWTRMRVEFTTLSQKECDKPCIEIPFLTNSKEVLGRFISRESDGSSLGEACKRHFVYLLSSKGSHYQWRVVCQLAEAATKGCQDEMTKKTDERRSFSIKRMLQYTTPLSQWLCLWTGWSLSLFSSFGPI